MNRVVSVLTTVFVGMGIVIAIGFRQPVQAQTSGKTLASREYTGLLKVLPANSKRRIEKIADNGFELSYEIGGKSYSASTDGNKRNRLRRENLEVNEGSVVIKDVTQDKALEITTYFFFDEENQKLTIDRKIRSTSSATVKLKMMREYVDSKLVLGGRPGGRSKITRTVLERIRTGHRLAEALKPEKSLMQTVRAELDAKFGSPKTLDCECPQPPRPCTTIACPPDPNYIYARLINPAPKSITLEFRIGTSLKQEGAATGNEARFVTALNLRRGPIAGVTLK